MESMFDFESSLLQIYAFFLETSLLPWLLFAILLFPLFIFFVSSRYSFSLIMSSFLFDSTIDISCSDSRGSIEQPMIDQEVISIGGSSLEDTLHGAFDSESSSLERVRDSHATGGDTSCPRWRAWHFAASGEPVPVIVILPLLLLQHSHSAGSPSSSPNIVGYKWVKGDVMKYKSFSHLCDDCPCSSTPGEVGKPSELMQVSHSNISVYLRSWV